MVPQSEYRPACPEKRRRVVRHLACAPEQFVVRREFPKSQRGSTDRRVCKEGRTKRPIAQFAEVVPWAAKSAAGNDSVRENDRAAITVEIHFTQQGEFMATQAHEPRFVAAGLAVAMDDVTDFESFATILQPARQGAAIHEPGMIRAIGVRWPGQPDKRAASWGHHIAFRLECSALCPKTAANRNGGAPESAGPLRDTRAARKVY